MKKRNAKLLAAAVLLPVLLAVAFPVSAFFTHGYYRGIVSLAHFLAGSLEEVSLLPEMDEAKLREPVTFLLFGVDAGEWVGGTYRPGPGRADTIVLIRAFPAEKRASILSIPRDTLAVIPGRPGDDKINHAYAFGQSGLLVAAVELFTGIEVDYYLGLNYRAFKDIVDLLEGVEFDVDRVIESRGLRLEPGLQLLDGDAAFALISTRRDPMGDIARVKRQQRFIKAVGGEVKERSFDDIFYIMLAVWNHVETNASVTEAVSLNAKLNGIEDEDITMAVVPGWFYNRGGISYWRPFPDQTARLIEGLFDHFGDEESVGGQS